MSFAARLTRSPRPFDRDRGQEAVALVAPDDPSIGELLAGAAGCSPYLATLMAHETEWLRKALTGPETAFDNEMSRLADVSAAGLGRELRRGKRRVALLTGLADLGGVWSLGEVTGRLTQFADLACQTALKANVAIEIKRGKIPGADPRDADTGAGMVILAMGKMGAGELNYSSDIDLICLFDDSRFKSDDYHDARSAFIRATRRMSALLSDNTGEGYVFRTDLRLRPDPAVTPVCMAMEAAERYYESLGRTWERAAYIKARATAGDVAAGESFIKALRPFVWRRHLDFAAIQDAHDMRLRIRSHKGFGGAINLAGHNVKLGRGGIREIEFFTQTRQLIAGGREPDLRQRGTCDALSALAQKNWVPADLSADLQRHYSWLREVEHRLQMVNDAQTHTLPQSPEGMARIAAFMDLDEQDLRQRLRETFDEVHERCEGFFAPDAQPESGADATHKPDDTAVDLDPDVQSRWRSYPALRSDRAVEIFNRLRPEILRRLRDTARPGEALLAFDGFLSGLPAGVQLFSLFDANPQLIDLMVDIVGTAPALAGYLSRNSSVLDAVIGGDFFAPWPERAVLAQSLERVLARDGTDYETRLEAARRWVKEWHFRTGVHHLRGLIDARTAAAQYADLAQVSIAALWPEVVAHFARRHGEMPGRGAAVIGMGSLGAGRLTSSSDLDLIVIYDAGDAEASTGEKPLAVRSYYARMTQTMVTALTAPMAEGRVYEVDMRLRPSGSQGPVATSWLSFQNYQVQSAWTWEHLALTRARVVAGSPELAADIESFRQSILGQDTQRATILSDVAEMRARIAASKSPGDIWSAKIGAGRLQDIELFAQTGALLSGNAARDVSAGLVALADLGLINAPQNTVLQEAYDLWWRLRMAARLLSDKHLDPDEIGAGGRAFLLRETDCPDIDALETALVRAAERSDQIITAALGGTAKESAL